MDKKKILKWVGYIIVPFIFAGFGLLLGGRTDIYEQINKPFFAPPAWLFPVVWSILYLLMGISYGLTEEKLSDSAKKNYYLQLIFNSVWMLWFFRLNWFLIAFIWLVALFYFVFKMYKDFKSQNEVAGNLQIPYLIWLVIAGLLNLSIVFLN